MGIVVVWKAIVNYLKLIIMKNILDSLSPALTTSGLTVSHKRSLHFRLITMDTGVTRWCVCDFGIKYAAQRRHHDTKTDGTAVTCGWLGLRVK